MIKILHHSSSQMNLHVMFPLIPENQENQKSIL